MKDNIDENEGNEPMREAALITLNLTPEKLAKVWQLSDHLGIPHDLVMIRAFDAYYKMVLGKDPNA